MNSSNDKPRVLIAITESSRVEILWRAAIRRVRTLDAGVTAVYLAESHWHRAASLPFTREISRVSGAHEDFTLRRASQLREEAIFRAREVLQKLASETDLSPSFEVLADANPARIHELVKNTQSVLIAPARIRQRPIFAEFEKLGCPVELVEESEDDSQSSVGPSR
jgi:hypothetical protein